MLTRVLKYILSKLDSRFPDCEPSDLGFLPAFGPGDLVEARPKRHHVLLDANAKKALIVDVYSKDGTWAYDVLLDGVLWTGVGASIVEADWKLSPAENELLDLSN